MGLSNRRWCWCYCFGKFHAGNRSGHRTSAIETDPWTNERREEPAASPKEDDLQRILGHKWTGAQQTIRNAKIQICHICIPKLDDTLCLRAKGHSGKAQWEAKGKLQASRTKKCGAWGATLQSKLIFVVVRLTELPNKKLEFIICRVLIFPSNLRDTTLNVASSRRWVWEDPLRGFVWDNEPDMAHSKFANFDFKIL